MIKPGTKVVVGPQCKLHEGTKGIIDFYVNNGEMCIIRQKDAEDHHSCVLISVRTEFIIPSI